MHFRYYGEIAKESTQRFQEIESNLSNKEIEKEISLRKIY
jgi:hypothetical protein